MDQKKPSGFSLFPQPPTPPARKSRTKSTSANINKFIKARPAERGHGRALSTCTAESTPPSPGLIPAPLRIRKSDEDIPPLPPLTTSFVPTTPVKGRRESTAVPKTPEHAPIRVTSHLPRTPSRRPDEANTPVKSKPRAVSDYVELEASNRRRASTRLSQWLDLEDGEIDQRRLSMYLGSVLDNTFEVPTLESLQLRPITPYGRRMSKLSTRPPTGRCDCPPDAIICHCSSSPEFERFNTWTHHKQSSSISSTACILGVPRARFQSAFYHIPDPSVAELPSPPGLSYDDDDDDGNASDTDDWLSPVTPSRNNIFSTPGAKSYSSKCAVSTSTSLSGGQSRFQSFSRPFRPDSTYRLMAGDDSASPSTPSRKGHSKKGGTKFLKSISTLSSFEFEFDLSNMGQSALPTQEGHGLVELPCEPVHDGNRDQSNHLRTESNESFASQVSHAELSTATATVARTGEGMKPVLVTNTAKRVKTPGSKASTSSTRTSSHGHSRTRSRSHSHSNLSMGMSTTSSDLESWRTAHDYFVSSSGDTPSIYSHPTHARSGTTATNTSTGTAGSTGLNALLHMPLLIPKRGASAGALLGKKSSTRRRKKSSTDMAAADNDNSNREETRAAPSIATTTTSTVVSGNAFSRSKSNPLPLLNPLLPDTGKEVVHAIQGPNQHSLAARSNTYTAHLSASPHHHNDDRNITPPSPVSPELNTSSDHRQQHRHRRGAPSRSGLRVGTSSGTHRMSNYLYVDDRRDDSGIFGFADNRGGGCISPVSRSVSPLPPTPHPDDPNRLAVPTQHHTGIDERTSYVSASSSVYTQVQRSSNVGIGIDLDIPELSGSECHAGPEYGHGYGYGHHGQQQQQQQQQHHHHPPPPPHHPPPRSWSRFYHHSINAPRV